MGLKALCVARPRIQKKNCPFPKTAPGDLATSRRSLATSTVALHGGARGAPYSTVAARKRQDRSSCLSRIIRKYPLGAASDSSLTAYATHFPSSGNFWRACVCLLFVVCCLMFVLSSFDKCQHVLPTQRIKMNTHSLYLPFSPRF